MYSSCDYRVSGNSRSAEIKACKRPRVRGWSSGYLPWSLPEESKINNVPYAHGASVVFLFLFLTKISNRDIRNTCGSAGPRSDRWSLLRDGLIQVLKYFPNTTRVQSLGVWPTCIGEYEDKMSCASLSAVRSTVLCIHQEFKISRTPHP